MSRLFGPFSVTRSRVSLRDCACAEKTAGAETAALAASAEADLRKSRRFIETLPIGPMALGTVFKRHARSARRAVAQAQALGLSYGIERDRESAGAFAGTRRRALHTMRLDSANFYALF